jgi:hypothetical protein
MMAFQAWPAAIKNGGKTPSQEKTVTAPKPIAPFNTEIARAARNCFDRESGQPVEVKLLKTYREILAQYHLRPETKFLNGDYLDRGLTRRRHVETVSIRHIGKEANRWEEQLYLGIDEDERIDYGLVSKESTKFLRTLRTKIRVTGQRKIARESDISRRSATPV